MPRRAAAFIQADIARLINGARAAGARVAYVEMPSGVKFSIPLDKDTKRSDIIEPLLDESDEEIPFTL